jgi:putative transcriptional regulator
MRKPDEIRELRRKLGLSQTAFAERFGLSLAVLKDWEQNRHAPDLPARVLLSTIETMPEAVSRAIDRTRGVE